MVHELTGGCHCGNIRVVYKTDVAPEDARPRSCQCSFCRKHNTAAVSDPNGELTLFVKDRDKLSRYQFGLKSCDFLVCRDCGVYVAAYMPEVGDESGFATLMAFALDEHARYPQPAPSNYSGEDAEGRVARRRKVWTPARLRIG